MLASLALMAVAATCPPAGPLPPVQNLDAPPPDALIVCVGDQPISGERFGHWLAIARAGAPDGAPATRMRRQVLEFLVSGAWIEGEARERRITVTDRSVRRRLVRQKRASFDNERQFERFLRESGMTRSDVKYRVRLDMVSERVRRDVVGRASPAVQQRRLERFLRWYRVEWRVRTGCARGYVVADCGYELG